jgi:hypothetical protein
MTMASLMVRAIATIGSLLKGLQANRFLAVVMVGFLLLTTNVGPSQTNEALSAKVRERVYQVDPGQKPKTYGEWEHEAAQDVPLGQRVRDIAEDSAEAFKQFGSGYTKAMKDSARDLTNGIVRAGENLSNQVR